MDSERKWSKDRVRQGIDSATQRWFEGPWPKWTRQIIFLQMAVAFVLSVSVFLNELFHYAIDLPGIASTVLWGGTAVLLLSAGISLYRESKHWPLVIVAAEIAILLLGAYALWIELRSPTTSSLLSLLLLIVPTAAIIPPLALNLGRSSLNVPKALSTLFVVVAAIGLTQFVAETQFIPNRTRPSIDMSAELVEIGRSGDVVHLLGRIAWTNNGLTEVELLGGLAYVLADSGGGGTSVNEPADLVSFADSLDPTSPFTVPYRPSADGGGVVWLDRLGTLGWFVSPDQTESREFVFDVDSSTIGQVELWSEASFLVNFAVFHDRWTACDGDDGDPTDNPTPRGDEQFSAAFRELVRVGNSELLCVTTKVRPSNTIRQTFGDDQRVEIQYYRTVGAAHRPTAGLCMYARADGRCGLDVFDRLAPNGRVSANAAWTIVDTIRPSDG